MALFMSALVPSPYSLNGVLNAHSLPNEDEVASFIDLTAAKEFDCSICLNILCDPVDIGCTNGHIYCNVCIARLIMERNNNNCFLCPQCRCICYIKSIRKMPFIQRQIKRLKVKCSNHTITRKMNELITTEKDSKKIDRKKERKRDRKRQKERKKRGRSCITIPEASRSRSRSPSRSRSRSRSGSMERNINSNNSNNLINNNNSNKKKQQCLCSWIGAWGDLDRHLTECEYEIILCEHCRKSCIRKNLNDHYLICSAYPIECDKCYESVQRAHISWHIEHLCPKAEMLCICGEKLLREDQPLHLEHECPEHLMKCEYFMYGCNQVIKRKNMQNHIQNNMPKHLASVTKQCNYLTNYVQNLNSRIQQIEQQFNLNRN